MGNGHKGPTSRDEAPIEGVGVPFFSKGGR